MLTEKNIKKHVTIIHAYSLMSSLQRKIVNVLLYEATKDKNHVSHHDSVAIECRIPFANLYKAIKFNSNNTQYLKEAIDSLASLKIEWNLLKDKVPSAISFLNLRVLHGSPTFYQDSTLNFSFHKVMLDLMENPSIYGTIDMDIQSQFDSKYSHALYENSTRFVNLQKNKVIQLDTFRKLLGVHADKYTNMRELTRNVILPSVEEVNDRADFIVHLEAIKIARKIIGFELSASSKKKAIKLTQKINDVDADVIKEIKTAFGELSEVILEKILKNYSEEYIREKIIYTKKYAKKENSGFYPIPYFISALRDDYKMTKDCQQNNHEELSAEEKQWQNKLYELETEVNHWQRLLEYASKDADSERIQNILTDCVARIQQHLLEKPMPKKRDSK